MQLRLFSMLATGLVLGYGAAIFTWSDVYSRIYAWQNAGDPSFEQARAQSIERYVQHRFETAPVIVTAPVSAPSMGGADERLRVDARGHVETHIEADGADMRVLVDTGASRVILRESDARRAGYRISASDYTVRVRTANGMTHAAPITLRSVELGSIRVRNVPALVQRDDQLSVNLLGMSFLSRLRGFQFENGYLLLEN
jgi:aspartyl protease family protein